MHTTEKPRVGDWMQTFMGIPFYPLDARPSDILIEDIAHALSNLCRFGGHCREFYSVAQHSVFVSELLPDELKLAGLLHDATEAYLVDVPRPIKRSLSNYAEIEDRLAEVIAERFMSVASSVSWDFNHLLVKQADQIALMTEARDLLGPTPKSWGSNVDPHHERIHPLCPTNARSLFLSTFTRLTS